MDTQTIHSKSIRFTDLSIAKEDLEHEDLLRIISDIMVSGIYVLGDHVKAFEQELSTYTGTKFAIGVNSGTDALILTLIALGIRTGDEVILPANSFIAIPNAVIKVGATPVFADINSKDLLISLDSITSKITKKTKAIIAVHLTGMPCEMSGIMKIAKDHNIFVIEDAAQAIGAEYNGQKAGSIGHAGCFSFHPLKNISAMGDAGAVVTDDPRIFESISKLRNHGLRNRDRQDLFGHNSRLDEFQAAILCYRLKKIDYIIARKREIAAIYNKELGDCVNLLQEGLYKKGVYQLYMIRLEKRDELKAYLLRKGIETGIHYPIPNHKQHIYAERYPNSCDLPNTEKIAKQILSLPIHIRLTNQEITYITETIKCFQK